MGWHQACGFSQLVPDPASDLLKLLLIHTSSSQLDAVPQRFRHKLPRSRLSVVICDICQGSQTIHAGNTCLQCGARFAAYFCSECGIANDDTPAQGYFHCDECGICRVGRDDDYFHCSCCDCCLKLDLLEVRPLSLATYTSTRTCLGALHRCHEGHCNCVYAACNGMVG